MDLAENQQHERDERVDQPSQVLRPSVAVPNPVVAAQVVPESCPACGEKLGTTAPAYAYALGTIEPRFPSVSVEKEFAQVLGRSQTSGLTDRQALHAVLSNPENRYLVRQMCWVLSVEGLETYIVVPRDPTDLSLLIGALRANPSPADLDVVIGIRGPIASPDRCNGLLLPLLAFDQIYSFDREALIKAIPRPEKIPEEEFSAAADELFARIQQMADNAGATDRDRALNYLAVRYPAIYAVTAEAHGRNHALSAVEVVPSRLSGVRKIVDVVLSFANRSTDVVEKHFVRVDVTDEFPFLATKLQPYYDR